MPIHEIGGAGGAGFTLGPPHNLFGDVSGDALAVPTGVDPAANRAAAEGVRDTYFTANPSNLAVYDGNSRLNIRLFYMISSEIVIVHQVRQNSAWVDNGSVTAVRGLPGSGTDFSGISDNHIPAIGPGPDKLPFDSGFSIVSGEILAGPNIQANSVRFDDAIQIASGVEDLCFLNMPRDIQRHAPLRDAHLSASDRVRNKIWNGATQTDIVRQPVDTETLVNPSFDLTADAGSANGFRLAALQVNFASAVTELELIVSRGGNELYHTTAGPFSSGLQQIVLMTVPGSPGPGFMDFLDGETYSFAITGASLLGNTSGVPYYAITFRAWDFEDMAHLSDFDQNEIELTGDLNITSANVNTYHRALLYIPSTYVGSDIDVNIEEGLDFDFIDFYNSSNSAALLLNAAGSDRIAGETDVRLTEFQSVRLARIYTNAMAIVFSNIRGGSMTDNYVDSVSFSGTTLTLGRTGTLPDLTEDIASIFLSEDFQYATSGNQNLGINLTNGLHIFGPNITSITLLAGTTQTTNKFFAFHVENTSDVPFVLTGSGFTFGGAASGTTYNIKSGTTVLFWVHGSIIYIVSNFNEASAAAVVLNQVVNHSGSGTINYAQEFAQKVHVLPEAATGFDTSSGASFIDDGLFVVIKQGNGTCEFDVSATGQTFAGLASGNAYDIPEGSAVWFYVNGTVLYPIPGGGGGGAMGDHPVVLTRDTPSLSELAALANASLDDNSALWVLSNNQVAATESGVDSSIMIRALRGGILDANGDEISTTAVQKSTVVLAGGTIVRIFSSTDLRVVTAPGTAAQEMRYPDVPFSGSINIEEDQGLYNSYLRRTATNAGGVTNEYIRMPDLHPSFRPSWVVPGDVFVMRHTGTATGSQRPAFRVDNTGDTIAGHGTSYFADPGETIAIQAPALGIRTWQLFPVSQRSDGVVYYDPETMMSDWYRDEVDSTAARNRVRLHNRHNLGDGLVRNHIRAAGHTGNPISLAFQRKNYQDSIALIHFWSSMGFAVPPLGTEAEEILANIPTSLSWIESNINVGSDFEFNAPDTTDGIESIGFISGNTIRYTMDSVIPSFVSINHEVEFNNCTNAINNGTFAVTFIDAPNRIIHITNPGRSDGTADEATSPGFMDVPIYCDIVLAAHDVATYNFNCYEDSSRTSLVTINSNWFDPDYEGVESVLAIGYNTDVETIPPSIAMEDDNGDYFLSLGGPRGQTFYFDNAGGEYQNTRYLPLNYEDIHIRTDGTCQFYLDLHPADLPDGQRRRYNIFSNALNDNDDVNIRVGRAGNSIVSDEGLSVISVLNRTSVELELYNAGGEFGWKLTKPFQKYIPSASLTNVVTPAEGPLAMSLAEIIAVENQDPNFSLFSITGNKITCRGRFRYLLTFRVKLRFDGNEDTGLSFVNVSLVPTQTRNSVTTDITRETGNSTAKIDFVRNGNNANDNTKPIYTLTGSLSYFAEPNDEIGWELRFGSFPAGYSLSDLRQIERQYTITVTGGID